MFRLAILVLARSKPLAGVNSPAMLLGNVVSAVLTVSPGSRPASSCAFNPNGRIASRLTANASERRIFRPLWRRAPERKRFAPVPLVHGLLAGGGGSRCRTRLDRVRVRVESRHDFANRLLCLHAVSCVVERRQDHCDSDLARRDGDDAAAHAALPGKAGVIQPFAGVV